VYKSLIAGAVAIHLGAIACYGQTGGMFGGSRVPAPLPAYPPTGTAPATAAPPPAAPPPGGPGPSSPLSNLPTGSPGISGTGQSMSLGTSQGMASGMEPTSAASPTHRHARHHGHVAAHHTTRGTPVSGNPDISANQMNADELARLQSGSFGNPPPSALPYGQPPGEQVR
jgi:hypothetical protein